jgi:hypothetical protein
MGRMRLAAEAGGGPAVGGLSGGVSATVAAAADAAGASGAAGGASGCGGAGLAVPRAAAVLLDAVGSAAVAALGAASFAVVRRRRGRLAGFGGSGAES